MKYVPADNGDNHILYLSEDETNQFFDVFDPNDQELASHLYHQGHRFIKDEAYNWLTANVGTVGIDWGHHKSGVDKRAFRFERKEDAMKFKLTFG